mgnify:CR=1 FL=1
MSFLAKIMDANQRIFYEYIDLVSKKYKVPVEELKALLNEDNKEQDPQMTSNLSEKTVAELKTICASLGIKKHSTKTKLIDAIEDYYKSTTSSSSNQNKLEDSADVIILRDKKTNAVEDLGFDDDQSTASSFDDTYILDDDDDDNDVDMLID